MPEISLSSGSIKDRWARQHFVGQGKAGTIDSVYLRITPMRGVFLLGQ